MAAGREPLRPRADPDASRAGGGRRAYGTGRLYIKGSSYYGMWWDPSGRRRNKRIGAVRAAGSRDGLTKAHAEAEFRRLRDQEPAQRAPRGAVVQGRTVAQAADALRERLALDGCRRSYLQNVESNQRVHLAPALGDRPLDGVTADDVRALEAALRRRGLSPKTVRNVLKFAHGVFAYAIELDWTSENPVARARGRWRRRERDTTPDLQFLSSEQLEAVVAAIPSQPVVREPEAVRRGRAGPAPPPPPDVISQVVRRMVLTAGMTGLRQSELIGQRWRDVDWQAQRIRPRNAYVRGEHSSEGKSVLSMSRSVPMTDRVAGELHRHWTASLYRADGDLVFAHPHLGTPLDRTKVTRIFQQGCRDAGVPVIRFHDLRHTFGTRCAAAGIPLRTIQEWLGHADLKTTQIYAHYAPSAHETAMVNDAFAPEPTPATAEGQLHEPGGA